MTVLIPNLVNVYLPSGETFAWLRLIYDGEDLHFIPAHKSEIGTMDEGFVYELEQMGWDFILDTEWSTEESGEGWIFSTRCLTFALQEGIAPGQPFLVHAQKPVYSKSWTDCGYEYDCDVDVDIARVEPWPAARVLRSWEKLLSKITKDREQARMAMRRLKDLRANDTSAMFLSCLHYGYRDYGDARPHGFAVRLCSQHSQVEGFAKSSWSEMLEGRDDRGDRDVAMQRLLEQVAERMPHLTPEFVKGLPTRHQ